MSSSSQTLSISADVFTRLGELRNRIERVFVGKSTIVEQSLITLLSGGHLLIEDVPGVGKTTLALTLAHTIGCSFQRIQFTSDMLPSDILGVSIPNPKTQEFQFKKGPLFQQVILADELNRATPRTQSALLEAMNEHQVTMDGQTYTLPQPFFVIATQNPHEHHGAFPLPESQLDRFMMRIQIGYPNKESERCILSEAVDLESLKSQTPCLSTEEVIHMIHSIPKVTAARVVDDYILEIVQATRQSPKIEVGVSPRGAIALKRACQARALIQGRSFTTPDDVKALAIPVLAHRLLLTGVEVSNPRRYAETLIQNILDTTAVPL